MASRGNYPEYLKCPCFRLVNYIALLILIYYIYMYMIHIQNMCLRSQTDSLHDGSCWKPVAPAARGDAAMGQKPQWINGKRGDPLIAGTAYTVNSL